MGFIFNFIKLLSKKDKITFFLLISGSILNVFLEILSIGMVIPLIGIILNPEVAINKLSNFLPDLFFIEVLSNVDYSSYIFYFLATFFCLFLLKNLFIFIYFYLQNKLYKK